MLAPSPSARPSKAVRRIRADILGRARRADEAGRQIKYELKPADKEVSNLCVGLLKMARPTAFALEGILVAFIRADRAAAGWAFPYADASARAIVGDALRIVGAKRPVNPDEGQRWYVSLGMECLNCHGPLDGGTTRRYFCSDDCAIMSAARRNYGEDKWRWGWEHSIYHVLKKKGSPFRKCAQCGTPYQGKPDSLYCSRRCSHIARTTIPDKECENCGTVFTPQRNEIRFCSRKCAGLEKKVREELKCEAPGCTNYFTARNVGRNRAESSNRYCSTVCYWSARRARAAA